MYLLLLCVSTKIDSMQQKKNPAISDGVLRCVEERCDERRGVAPSCDAERSVAEKISDLSQPILIETSRVRIPALVSPVVAKRPSDDTRAPGRN